MKAKKLLWVLVPVVLAVAVLAVVFWPDGTESEPETVTVVFQDSDGTVLKTEEVEPGDPVVPPTVPEKDGYTFMGWDKDLSQIIQDTVVTVEQLRETDAVITVESVTLEPGAAEAEVKLSVTNNPGILGMLLSLQFDDTALQLVDCKSGAALSGLTYMGPSRYVNGCNFTWYGSETGKITDGELLSLTFRIPEGTEPGTYPIAVTWNERDIFDGSCNLLNPKAVAGGIVIPE